MFQVKILFVDDHPGLREGVSNLVNQQCPEFQFIQAADVQDALNLARQHEDITNAIIDISLGEANGLALIPELRKITPSMNVIVYTMYTDILHIETALHYNIQGYVTKNAAIEELVRAITFVSQGSMYYCKEAKVILNSLLGNASFSTDKEYIETAALFENYKMLTPKEQEVFSLLANEKDIDEIVALLKKNKKTVINQKSQIYQKLNVKDRLSLIRAARKLGVIL